MIKKKKVRSLFFRNKAIVSEKKRLKALEVKRKELINNIKDIIDTFNFKSLDIPRTSEWLERFPLKSLVELYDSLSQKNDLKLSSLQMRSRLQKEHNLFAEQTVNTDKEIYLSNIDLLLAKINCVQSKLGDK